jgi:hypothetical protein
MAIVWVVKRKSSPSYQTPLHMYLLRHSFPNILLADPILPSKNNHESSHPGSSKHIVSLSQASKTKKLCLRTDFRYVRIRNSNTRNNALRDFTSIELTVVRFVGTGGLFTRYSNDHMTVYFTEMYPRIPWELVADPLGPTEHTLRTAVQCTSLHKPTLQTAIFNFNFMWPTVRRNKFLYNKTN